MCGCLSHAPIGDLAINPGMCPDWESNQRAFGLQAHAQSTELHQLGIYLFLERGEGREKERETLMYERYINQLPLTLPQLGTRPTTQACALTGN